MHKRTLTSSEEWLGLTMNESEYITDVETTEEYIPENSTESDSPPVIEINDIGAFDISSVFEVSETSETSCISVSDVDNLVVIANNISGIFLMNTALFFAVVIAFIAKIFGGYFSL